MRITELLAQTREKTLGAYAHQDLPFERLVEELRPERDTSRNPIFQVMFIFQNAPIPAVELPGLQLEAVSIPSHGARFDLELSLQDFPGAMPTCLNYSADLFEPTAIERMLAGYEKVLQAIAADATGRWAS